MKYTVGYYCEKPESMYRLHKKIYVMLKKARLQEDVLQKVMDELNELSQASFTEGAKAVVRLTKVPVRVEV